MNRRERRSKRRKRPVSFRLIAAVTTLAMPAAMGLPVVAANAVQAPAGAGFNVTPSDLSFILKQIKIAEAHVANTTSETGPCGALLGTGPNQLASPMLSLGLRTVDGSCNHLEPGQDNYGAADQVFPRLGAAQYKGAENSMFGPPAPSSYAQKKGDVFDSQPRVISNLIVDQTSTNPAAVSAAGKPVRSQGNEGVVPCTTDPDPLAEPPVVGVPENCIPSHSTLFIPNITTDVGLSPPYNSLFTLFGQFFDHGIDQTVKGGGSVYIPLKADDPLIAGPNHKFDDDPATATVEGVDDPATAAVEGDDLPTHLRFMALTRGLNQPGPDGILGDNPGTTGVDESADDVQNALNTDSPWVDQSQTYTSHPSHQVFLREYAEDATTGRPVATGKLLGGPAGPTEGGMATWATTKKQAQERLGIQLLDKDVLNVPMIKSDLYGNFIPGPNGFPVFMTASGEVEANPTDNENKGTLVPADALYFNTPFLTDIAHNADPSPKDHDHNPRTPAVAPSKDTDTTASADFANQPAGTYDDEMLDAHFIAGDGRVNENIGLTAVHQVFHSEHDRLIDDFKATLAKTENAALKAQFEDVNDATFDYGERLFQAARFVTEMEYQHLVFEEFARKIQPLINPFQPFAFTQTDINPAIKAEFAHAVYRFGHSMLTETISRRNEYKPGPDATYGTSDDIPGSENDISLLAGFLNPPAYTDGGDAGQLTSEEAAGSIIMGMSDQEGNELDEFVTDTLRNNLLGLPLDLATINMTRARSEGVPTLNNFRKELHAKTNDGQLKPYTNWIDFGENLKHPESLINFVAAYGKHPTILADAGPDKVLGNEDDKPASLKSRRDAARAIVNPDTVAGDVPPADAAAFMNSSDGWADENGSSKTGLDDVELWVGGLAERTNMFGGLLGSTFNFVFEQQLTELQNGDRFYYLARTPGMNLRAQLEGNSFAELMMRNTNAQALKADAFATADCKFELKNLAGTREGFNSFGNTVADDTASDCDESKVLIRMSDGTIKYRMTNTVDPSGINGQSVFNGTFNADRAYGGNDNDTFWGGEGNDILEGGDGADIALGGEGNDIITDIAGDDVHKGGPGNDAIDAGPGLDIIMGGDGSDFTNGGANINETFSGEGNDFAIAGQGEDAVFGDGGDDWQEGGDEPDLLIGDSSNLFFLDDSQKPGHDILFGQGGDDDYDMEGGDDVGLAGPGIEKIAGASGYDWEIGLHDPQPQDADLDLPILPLDILAVGVRDRYNEVEALSGGPFDDKLRGDDIIPSERGGGGFIGCNVLDVHGVNRISGLNELIPDAARTTPIADVIAASASKDCPLLDSSANAMAWGDGNILLGGGGSDIIEGRGGNDIIDGDRYLNVRLSVRNDAGAEIGSATGMTAQYLRNEAGALTGATLQADVFAGKIDPGNIVAVREILSASGGTDRAVFSDIEANYTVTETDGVTTVSHNGGGTDGVDTLRNVETLVFADSVPPSAPTGVTAQAGNGQATVNFTAAETGGITDQFSIRVLDAASGTQIGDIRTAPGGDTSMVIDGLTNGVAVKFEVRATNVHGESTVMVTNIVTPVAPVLVTAVPSITGTATAGSTLTAATGVWGPAPVALSFQWFSNGVAVVGATQSTYTVRPADVGQPVTVRVTGAKDGYESVTMTSEPVVAEAAPVVASALRDFTGDTRADLIARDSSGVLWTYPGTGNGLFGTRIRVGTGWNALSVISAAGDLTGDGKPDLVGRDSGGVLWTYPGTGNGLFGTRIRVGTGWNAMSAISAAGDLTGDGKPDLVARDSSGVLWTYPGTGNGLFGTRIRVGSGWNVMRVIS